MAAPARHFVTVDGAGGPRRVHYTRMGDGPPVLMLHASATSSGEMLLPQSVFARDFTAIAFDTPGYGLSEPLTLGRAPEIEDYADALAATVAALGIGPAAVYGRHTGASIAVDFARRHPARCAMVLTDGYPIWTAEERARMLGAYLPSLEPDWDGGHLLWSWFRYRDQHAFWPWFDWRAASRATRDVPPLPLIHRGVIELQQAGDGYRIGYSAAFRHDGWAGLQGVAAPVCLGTRPSDLIHPMRDRAPPDAWRAELPPDALAAAVAERALLHRHPGAGPVPPAPPCTPVAGRSTPDFLRVAGDQMLLRRAGLAAGGDTLLLIGEVPGATATLVPLLDALRRPAIAFDLPGLGESEGDVVSVEDWAARLLLALDQAGAGRVRIYAHRGGCSVAAALALLAPERVAGLLLAAPLAVAAPDRAGLVDRYAPDASPGWDGGHLLRVWHHLRDQEIWWPWFDRRQDAALATDPAISSAALAGRALACLQQPGHYRAAWQAIWRYELLTALAAIRTPVTVAAAEGDAFGHLAGAAASAAGTEVARLPGTLAGLAALLDDP